MVRVGVQSSARESRWSGEGPCPTRSDKVNDVIADLQSLALAKCTDNLILLAELCSLRRGFQHVQT